MNPYKDIEESSFATSPHLAYEDIATKLLKDHYFLTALELHTELVESGKELPQLREFFSNPGNFEQHVSRASELTSMHRTPSQATLDSLDTARYSEDGGGDRGGSGGDVAVLEFELRKARETINALRANLTQFADGESTLEKSTKNIANEQLLKPHEKRALNFLINEYLLMQDYKLTSITFSDENPDQEFEDWDDVGLNMPRPAGLVSLFRGKSLTNSSKCDAFTEMEYVDTKCQTDDEGNVCVSCQTSMDVETDWSHELLIQAEEIELLKQKVIELETEKLNFQKLYDAALVSLNSFTSPTSEGKGLDLHLPEEKMSNAMESQPLTFTATENHYGSGNSTHSATPEQFEMIDSEKNSTICSTRKEGSTLSSLRRESATTLDETLSLNDAGEWTRVQLDCAIDGTNKDMWIDSALPNSLKDAILSWCNEATNANEPLSNDLLAELVTCDKPINLQDYLTLIANTLPRIVPHTLVGRRGEAAAALAATVALRPSATPALSCLLTLLKKPDPADTRLICQATCLIVKWGASGEVLSAIAELLSSRTAERRILAGQVCLAIAPYVPIELCTSLLLSLVIMMCESNEPELRSLGLKAVCLICPMAEHKYNQIENLMFTFLKDPVERCVKDTVGVFVPVLARTALIAGKFSTDLCPQIMRNLSKVTDSEWKMVLVYLEVLKSLVLAKLAYVINVQIVKEMNPNCDKEVIQEISLDEEKHFVDLQCYVESDVKFLLVTMNALVREKPHVRWTELDWFILLIKELLDIATKCKALNHSTIYELLITLFTSYTENFGLPFSQYILSPIFLEIITDLEQKMEKLHAINVDSTVVVGVYLVSVLPAMENQTQHGEFLQKWIMYSSIRSLPVKTFSIPLKWVSEHKPESLNFYLQHLREFSASSCESASGSSIRVYIADLIADFLNITEVSEKCIERQLLPAVMALLHDDDVSVRESAISAWGRVTRACLIRGLPCEEQCWPPLEHILGGGRLSSREATRAAQAIALLVLPTQDSRAVSERAVSALCALCSRQLTAESISALAPGLQLAVHHCRHHPDLINALRKVEEAVQSPSLSQYKPAIESLIASVRASPLAEGAKARAPPTASEVGRRVTLMFNQHKNNMHLHNIFKKKT